MARSTGVKIVMPDDFDHAAGRAQHPPRDRHARPGRAAARVQARRVLAFVRANDLNRIVLSGGRNPKIGIITVGKSYLDVRQALDDLGIDEVQAPTTSAFACTRSAAPGRSTRSALVDFARGLDKIIVVEEKRSLIEVQLREELYGTANQPLCIGKKDEHGDWLFPAKGALDPNDIAIAIGERLLALSQQRRPARPRGAAYARRRTCSPTPSDVATRTPYFCSGCPHNSSTKVPEGMRAYAGIGCHYMVQWMDRATDGFTQMGGEGANWIGEAPFSKRGHVFQNLGDGTYNHSGVLALRWSIATKTNVTYKILFNDAVAMTGGQPHEGNLTVDMIARQVRGRRRRAHRARHRRAGQIPKESARRPASTSITATTRRGAARAARDPGRHGADLRPDLRRRKAPPPQARRLPRSGQARHHQRSGLRGLRRLRRAVELRLGAAGRDRVRPQAQDRPVELQQGLLLREGLLPVLRHGAWRQDPKARRSPRPRDGRRDVQAAARSGDPGRSTRTSASSSRASAAPAS